MYKEYEEHEYVLVGGKRILLKKNNGIPFIKSDLRRCELRYSLDSDQLPFKGFPVVGQLGDAYR